MEKWVREKSVGICEICEQKKALKDYTDLHRKKNQHVELYKKFEWVKKNDQLATTYTIIGSTAVYRNGNHGTDFYAWYCMRGHH